MSHLTPSVRSSGRLARQPAVWLLAALLTACAAPARRQPPATPAVPPVAQPTAQPAAQPPAQPEAASGWVAKPGWSFPRFAVAAANPLATGAGTQILRAGGSAVDAAIAVQMVLGLVEPQSSGLGGGAFLLHHDGKKLQAFDGRETAPASATEDQYLDAGGAPRAFMDAVLDGRSVGVPGTVAMLAMAHQQHGKLPWAKLFEPAIVLAQSGFPVSARLHSLLSGETALRGDPVAAAYFYRPDGTPHPVGHLLRNPEYAAVLNALSQVGPRAFYEGPVARAIVDKVNQRPGRPGRMSLDDLAKYEPREREALCSRQHSARGRLRLCGFPPPSSGAIAVGQIMGLMERTPQAAEPLVNGVPSVQWLHSYTEASRLAFADRAQYIGDPDFVVAPGGRWASLLDDSYLNQRARLIGPTRAEQAPAGRPSGLFSSWAPMPEQVEYGTSHVSIADGFGNVLAMTSTIEDGFGTRLMVTTKPGREGGFLLNNELTDFSFTPKDAQGRWIANRVQPGKRPRSSMAPTLVFDEASGRLLMSAGSPGGALIIHFTAKTLWGVLNWGLTPQAAIELPNFGFVGGPLLIEDRRFPLGTRDSLVQRGHATNVVPMASGLQALVRGEVDGKPVWLGGADPRREGVVMGD
jgi:gamma-glutamyltranspeptidase/glutathione hydrolase